MVQFVLLLDAAQDRNRILDRRLADEDGLETPREGCVLLDVLAVLVERGGAHAMQFAAGQRRLQQVGRIHRAIRLAGTHQRVHLVDEQDDAALGGCHFREHRLQPLLEFAAILRTGDERAHVERQQLLVLEALRHVALDDAQGETLGDGGLADAGLADEHGIVLGAPRQHLDGAADLLVAADDRIELAVLRGLGEVAGIFLQRIIALLGGRRVGRASLADRVDRLIQALRGDTGILQDLCGFRLLDGQGLQQALGGNEAVARLLGKLLRGIEDARHFRREIDLTGT